MDKKIFDTPILQYLKLREDFLKKFRQYQVWGKFGSKKRVVALDGFNKYYRETMVLVAKYPNELDRQVILDNKNLVYAKSVLPRMPWKLREELVLAAPDSCGYGGEEQLDKMFAKVEEEKSLSLMMFEMNELERVNNFINYEVKKKHCVSKRLKEEMKEDKFQLRDLRKEIYRKIKLQQNVDTDFVYYQFHADEYFLKFHKDLTKKELKILANRLKRTEDAVEKYRAKDSSEVVMNVSEENVEAASLDDNKPEDNPKDVVKEYEADRPRVGSQVSMNVTENKVDSTDTSFDGKNVAENEVNDKEFIALTLKKHYKSKAEELLVEKLPDVPTHFIDDTFDNNLNPVDEELESRLLKLKSFRKTIVQDVTDNDVAPHGTFPEEPKKTDDSNHALEDDESVFIIEDERAARDAFNAWYEKVDVLRKKKRNTTDENDAKSFDSSNSKSNEGLYDKVIPGNGMVEKSLEFKESMFYQTKKSHNFESSMVNLNVIMVMMFATSQLMFGQFGWMSKSSESFCLSLPSSSQVSPFPSFLSKATPVRESKCLPTTVLMTRTREELCGLAYEWRLWLEVMVWEKVWTEIRSVKEIFDIVSYNLVNRKFWRKIVSILGDSKV